MTGHQKGINQSSNSIVSANPLFEMNSPFPGFSSQTHHMLPFNGQIASVDHMKIEHQNLPADSILEFSGPTMHEVTNTRLKNLINNRKNQKEMQNFLSQQNVSNIYPDEPPLSPINVRPRSNESDNFVQTAQSVSSQSRTVASDNGTSNEDSNYNNQPLEPTYEPLRNLPPPSPDSELSWRKNNTPDSIEKENMQKDLENGHQENDKGTKTFLLTNSQSNESLNFSETGQDSVNGYPYRSYFEANNSQELRNVGIETYSNSVSGQDSYHSSSIPKTPQKYSSQNAQSIYNSQYYQNTSEINNYPGSNQNENSIVSQNSYTPTPTGPNTHSSSYSEQQQTQQQPSQSPVSKDPLPSPYAQNQSSPYEQQQNGKTPEISSVNTGQKNSAVDVISRINKDSSDQEHFLLNSTTSMNTYSNIINTFNVNASNFATSNPPVTSVTHQLPAIASLFSSGHTVISSASDLGSQLKVSYSNPTQVTTSPWPSGGSHPSHIDSGRNEEFCGLDPSSLGGIFSSFITTSVSSPVPITSSSDTGKAFATNTSEANWWEHLKTSVKLEVPPGSPECEVLENQSSSPSTISLPTSL